MPDVLEMCSSGPAPCQSPIVLRSGPCGCDRSADATTEIVRVIKSWRAGTRQSLRRRRPEKAARISFVLRPTSGRKGRKLQRQKASKETEPKPSSVWPEALREPRLDWALAEVCCR